MIHKLAKSQSMQLEMVKQTKLKTLLGYQMQTLAVYLMVQVQTLLVMTGKMEELYMVMLHTQTRAM